MWRYLVRIILFIYQLLLRIAMPISLFLKPSRKDSYSLLLTGNFYSDNWIYAQLKPLSLSSKVNRIRMVAEREVPSLDKVEPVYPPHRLSALLGKDIARLLTFVWLSITTRPDVIGGFHLLVNGLLAILLAKFVGARSLYVCGGGPREVAGGGYACENKIFGRLGQADGIIEKQLIDAVSHADIVVTRGMNSTNYFLGKGAESAFYFIPAGIDGDKYQPTDSDPEYDLILVGRLTDIKRVDLYLQAIAVVAREYPHIRAAVVGDGPLMEHLQKMANELKISNNVDFLGHRDDVDRLLNRSRIFVLTSDSEGLSQAMIQAMLSGLPAIVSNVGDLSELVTHEVNGYLIDEQAPELFAQAIGEMLEMSRDRYSVMREDARTAAMRCDVKAVAYSWDNILDT
jgi:glycosyltransferase involved in cell wall biosynthesis